MADRAAAVRELQRRAASDPRVAEALKARGIPLSAEPQQQEPFPFVGPSAGIDTLGGDPGEFDSVDLTGAYERDGYERPKKIDKDAAKAELLKRAETDPALAERLKARGIHSSNGEGDLHNGAAEVVADKLFGFGDEAAGITTGLTRLVTGPGKDGELKRGEDGEVRTRSVLDDDPGPIMRRIDDAVGAGVKTWRDINDDAHQFREDHPAGSLGVALAAGATDVLPAVKAFGVAEKGVGALTRLARGAKTGAKVGAVAGFGQGDTVENRVKGAAIGVPVGATLGGSGAVVAPYIVPTASKASGAVAALLADESGNVRIPGITPTTPPPVAPAVDNRIIKYAERSGGEEGLRERTDPFYEQGVDPLTGQALGAPGERGARVTARSPGDTQQLARKVANERKGQLPARVQAAIDKAFPATSRAAAQAEANGEMSVASAEYNRVLTQTKLEPNMGAILDSDIQKLPPKYVESIMPDLEDLARLDGLDPDTLTHAQSLHYLKVAVDAKVKFLKQNGDSTGLLPRLTGWAKRFRADMDRAIPGYGEVRAKWGDPASAEESLQWSSDFFDGKLRPDEVKAQFAAFTPYQQEKALISIAEKMRTTVEQATKLGVRQRNVTQPFMNENVRNRLQTVLGKEKTDDLYKVLNLSDEEFNYLSRTSGGSDTVPDLQEAADMGVDLAGVTKATAKRGFIGAIDHALGAGIDHVSAALMRRARDEVGAELWSTLPQTRRNEIITELQRREAVRLRNTNKAATGARAASGGTGALSRPSD